MNRAVAVAFLLAAVVLVTPSPATARSCMGPNPACQAFWKIDAVFDGQVVSIESAPRDERLARRVVQLPEKLVTLDVRQTWKGASVGRVQVLTATTGAACGFNFKVGRRYLVLAYDRSVGPPGVSLCSSTRPFEDAADLPEFLDSLSRPATGGRVFGSVTLYERLKSSCLSEKPFELAIRLTGNGQKLTTRSADGRHEFLGLPIGSYEVTANLPEGCAPYGSPTRTVEIQGLRGCAEIEYGLMVREPVYRGPVRR